MENLVMRPNFWKNKRVLITGHTGFKGSWLTLWLKSLGAEILGYALKPEGKQNLYLSAKVQKGIKSVFSDIQNFKKLKKTIDTFSPEIVFHLAAQALVKVSYSNPNETLSTNINGTINLLESLKNGKSIKSIVIVTSDKVYEDKDWDWGYRENDSLGGFDPYSSSKACCEIITNSYRSSFFKNKKNKIGLATARAGNVIGGGDYSKYRLIPDIIRSIENKKILKIRNKYSTRPWQHVLEALRGYLYLAEQLYENPKKYSQAWNFGPDYGDCKEVDWVLKKFKKKFKFNTTSENKNEKFHESNLLRLDISKSKRNLNWNPELTINEALNLTADWYHRISSGEISEKVTLEQINNYQEKIL